MANRKLTKVSRRKFLEMAAVTGVAGVAAACAAPTQAPAPTAVHRRAVPATKAPAPTNTPVPPTPVPTVKKEKVLNLGVNVGRLPASTRWGRPAGLTSRSTAS